MFTTSDIQTVQNLVAMPGQAEIEAFFQPDIYQKKIYKNIKNII